ncbi:hypothetical protein BDR05DRAFT_866356, partial [Suillus weaverae]
EKSEGFLMHCILYLNINGELYKEEKQKIIYVLSYMNKENVLIWKEDFLCLTQDLHNKDSVGNIIGYRKWADFFTDFKKSFTPLDVSGTLLAKL